jgi:hypothetical protein
MRKHMMMVRWMSAVCLVVAVQACSSGTARRQRAPDLSAISQAELDAAPYSSAFEVVQALRPNWLRIKGATTLRTVEYIRVYLDGSLLGAPDQLRNVTKRSIASIRFMDGVAATQRWGLDHGQGAIVVSTRQETTNR